MERHFAFRTTDMLERYTAQEQLTHFHSSVQTFITMMIVRIPLIRGTLALPKYCGKLVQ